MADAGFTPFPTVAPTGAPSDYQKVNVSPEAFGASVGRAEEESGSKIAGAGSQIFAAGIQRAELQDELIANDANTQATKQMGQMFGDFSSLRGRAAKEGLDSFTSGITDLYKSALAAAPNDKARALLSQSMRVMGDRYINYGQMHANEEFNRWQNQSALDAADEHQNQAMLAATNDDPKGMDASLQAGAQQQVKIAEQNGLEGPQKDALVHKWMGKTVYDIIKGTLAEQNPDSINKAKAIFDKYKDQMDAAGQVNVLQLLKPIVKKATTDLIAQRVTAPGGFLHTLLGVESGGADIANTHQMTTSGQAQGYFQITTGTWKEFGEKAGIDLRAHPQALGSPYAVQAQVASIIPLRRWDPKTIAALQAKGFNLNLDATLGENLRANGEGFGAGPIGKGGTSNPDSAMASAAGFTVGNTGIPTLAMSAMAPHGVAIARALAETADDPGLRASVLAQVNSMYSNWHTENATKIAELNQNVPAMIRSAESGELDADTIPFPYDDLNNYMPDKALEWIPEFEAAKKIGMLVQGYKWESPEAIEQARADLAAGHGPVSELIASQTTDNPGEFFRLQQMGEKRLEKALTDRQKELAVDPASYVQANPAVSAARAAMSPTEPKTFEKYAIASLAVQQQLGVESQFAHVLTKPQAQDAVKQLTANNGEGAKTGLNLLQARTGAAFPQVYNDLVTLGKLAPEYQALQVLSDPGDLTIMQKTLAEEGKDPTKGWPDRLGSGDRTAGEHLKTELDTAVTNGLTDYTNSLRQSGVSEDDINNVTKAVRLLAYGNRYFSKDEAAAENAVKSFVGRYSYMPQGGARVPNDIFKTVQQNASTMLQGIDANNIKLPEETGKPGQMSAEAYLAWLKNAPEWVTAPTGDRLYLRQPGGFARGKLVRGLDGNPVSVMFSGDSPFSPNFKPVPAPNDRIVDAYKRTLIENGMDPEKAETETQTYKKSLQDEIRARHVR